ncbi:MAG: hypothetical protein PHE36_13120, partial [Novosphingobium sp.]|nr:hypothetical protein [Novosphingobium sp.]
MIQLSTVSATSPENPAKAPVSAPADGVFATLLVEGLGTGGAAGGKILPAGGKMLPVALPVDGTAEGEAATAAEIPAARLAAKVKALARGENGNAVSGPAGRLPAGIAQTGKRAETEADSEAETDAAATPATGEVPHVLLPAPLAFQAATPAEAEEGEQADLPQGRGASPKTLFVLPAVTAKGEGKTAAAALQTKQARDAGNKGEAVAEGKQAPAQTVARSANSSPRSQAYEIHFDLSRDAKPGNAGKPAGPRTAQAALAVLPAAPAVQARVPDALNAVHGGNDAFDAANQQQGLRPHEFTALVDRLVEARESARGGSVDIAVMHADFGEVSLRFSHDNGNLTVSMANPDPEFAHAVHAAAPADGSQTGDAPSQGNRRDDGTQNSTARAGADAQASSGAGTGTGGGGTGRHR